MQYLAITKDMLVEDTEVGCDLYLKSYVDGRQSRYVLFCRGDEQFGRDRKGVLIEGNIEKLYIPSNDYNNFFKYQEKNLPDILANNNLSSREKSHAVYHVAKNLTKEILEDICTPGVDLDRARNWVKYTIGFILNDEHAFSGLLSMTSHDYYTYTHSLNLSVFGLLFGKHLGLGADDLNTFGTGLLLHDVGKIDVPLEILNKPGRLTNDEYGIIKRHPEAGYEILKGKENIEDKSLKVVIQHHENHDGTGYPHGIGGNEIGLYGRISRIIDVYDAITTKRCYAGAMNPFTALKEMGESMVKCFDIELFKEFVCFLGPKGSQKIKDDDGIVCLKT